MPPRVSLAEVLASGVVLRPAEAAGIVAEVCARIGGGDLRGVPSPHVLRLSPDGGLSTDGPVEAHRATIARAAQLLDDLLTSGDETPDARAPGALRLTLLRARGNVDLPPYSGLSEFAAALRRFAPEPIEQILAGIFARWRELTPEIAESEPPAPATVLPVTLLRQAERDLTVSDIRRARRATGLTLQDVADRSRIPRALLRELEWGYLWNWPDGLYGRAQLVRYARAAGLDERVVLGAVWPLLEEVAIVRGGEPIEPVPAEEPLEIALQPEPRAPLASPVAHPNARPPKRGLIAAAAVAALALAIAPAAFWNHSRTAAVPDTAPLTARGEVHLPPSTDLPPPSAPPPATAPATGPDHPSDAPVPRGTSGQASSDGADASGAPRMIPAVVSTPAFASAGTASFQDEGAHRTLVSANSSGPGTVLKITRVLDDEGRNYHARPSPDGALVAFDSDRDGMRGVYVATADGTGVRRISGDGFAALPSWSPDGQRLAFVKAEPGHPAVWNLWIADLGSGEARQVTFYRTGQRWGGSWFPDGHRLAYTHQDGLVVQDLNTGAKKTYRSPLPGRLLRTPAVSPDGRRIIFHVDRDGTWLLDLTSGGIRRVLDDPTADGYTWSADGRRVAFHSERAGGWGVWVMGE